MQKQKSPPPLTLITIFYVDPPKHFERTMVQPQTRSKYYASDGEIKQTFLTFPELYPLFHYELVQAGHVLETGGYSGHPLGCLHPLAGCQQNQ